MFTEKEQKVLNKARGIIESKLRTVDAFTSPVEVKQFLQFSIIKEHEVFAVLFLDQRHRLLAFEEMFRGTIDGASVFPREVAKAALLCNAAAVIFAHNHPSGVPEPSQSDMQITRRLVDALQLLDVRVLDHFVVAPGEVVSFAERGLL